MFFYMNYKQVASANRVNIDRTSAIEVKLGKTGAFVAMDHLHYRNVEADATSKFSILDQVEYL